MINYKKKERQYRDQVKRSTGWIKHWHLANYSNAIYEQKRYKSALKPIEQAYAIAPNCPYVLWNYAGTLRMLGKISQSKEIYKNLIKLGTKKIAYGECGEGIKWARSIINDCRYMLGLIAKENNQYKEAIKWYRLHLRYRSKNTTSIFNKKEVIKELKGIK